MSKKKVQGMTLTGKVIEAKDWRHLFKAVPETIIIPLKSNGKPINPQDFDFNKFFKPIITRKMKDIKDMQKY